MSLLDHGSETVTVYPVVDADDGYGGTLPGPGAPVVVRARVEPLDSTEHSALGHLTDTLYRVAARSLPAGPWSRVEWAGAVWAVVGEPWRFTGPRRLSHATAVIRKRGDHGDRTPRP